MIRRIVLAATVCVISGAIHPLHAQPATNPDTQVTFEVEDGGRKRRFELAMDELAEKPKVGKERAAKDLLHNNLSN